ncbi:glycoside hydrolase family 3 C-terminal domain-containing protein [Flavobacteriaceae bacterium MHTCC 0001]
MRFPVFILFVISVVFIQAQESPQPWYDTNTSFDERIELLIGSMDVKEKVSQLLNSSPEIKRLNISQYNWWNEALHGVARSGKATVFPQTIGMAASFDKDMMFRVGTAISDEARAINNHLISRNGKFIQYMGLSFWSPNVNIFRDPRWGRGQETYGEDPLLSGILGAQFIKGMQGDHPKYLKTAACAKHYAVHSGPEALRHEFNAVVDDKDLYETYLPAFKLCIDAGVEAVMCAYNRTNDKACCGSDELLMDILRGDWGFEGHIVSDCGALKNFHNFHEVTKTKEESAALALLNGVDINCGGTYWSLMGALEQGLISEADIDKRLRKVLSTRFRLGFFDDGKDNPYTKIPTSIINNETHRNLAKEAGHKSIVLLQNKNNVLPLKKDLPFVYMGGPLAADVRALIGNYHGLSPDMTTLVEGVVRKTSPSTRLQYRSGTLMSTPNQNPIDWYSGQAKTADATIVGVGFSVLLEGEEGEAIASNTMGDNVSMQLPENQMNYLRKVGETDKPLIVVVFAGCPIDLSEIKELADAIIYAWYPGEEGGNALADVIFGDVSPSGKLPITFPKSVEQLPPYEDYSMDGRTYKYMKDPLYPFGFGLSYAKFSLGELSSNKTKFKASKNEEISMSVTITNESDFKAEEVLQLYMSIKDSNLDVPHSELKDFKRVVLLPKESKTVTFSIHTDAISYIDEKGKKVPYKGAIKFSVGNASPGERSEALGVLSRFVEMYIK